MSGVQASLASAIRRAFGAGGAHLAHALGIALAAELELEERQAARDRAAALAAMASAVSRLRV